MYARDGGECYQVQILQGTIMPKFKAYHHYKLKNPKGSSRINEIIPLADREVRQSVFDEYEDTTVDRSALVTMVKFDCLEEV